MCPSAPISCPWSHRLSKVPEFTKLEHTWLSASPLLSLLWQSNKLSSAQLPHWQLWVKQEFSRHWNCELAPCRPTAPSSLLTKRSRKPDFSNNAMSELLGSDFELWRSLMFLLTWWISWESPPCHAKEIFFSKENANPVTFSYMKYSF